MNMVLSLGTRGQVWSVHVKQNEARDVYCSSGFRGAIRNCLLLFILKSLQTCENPNQWDQWDMVEVVD